MAWAWTQSVDHLAPCCVAEESTAMLMGETLEGSVARGCLQGGHSVVEPGCGGGLDGNDCYTLEYADDIAILLCKKFRNTLSELL